MTAAYLDGRELMDALEYREYLEAKENEVCCLCSITRNCLVAVRMAAVTFVLGSREDHSPQNFGEPLR